MSIGCGAELTSKHTYVDRRHQNRCRCHQDLDKSWQSLDTTHNEILLPRSIAWLWPARSLAALYTTTIMKRFT